MKKISSVLLILLIVISFGGCANEAKGISDFLSASSNDGLVEITDIGENFSDVISADFNGDSLALVTLEIKSEEEYIYHLYIINAKRGRVHSAADLSSCPLESISAVEYKDNGSILIIDEYEEQAVEYNSDLIQSTEPFYYKPLYNEDYYETAMENSYTNGAFAVYKNLAWYYSNDEQGETISAYTFYDDSESVYFADCGMENYIDGHGRTALASLKSEDDTKETVGIIDFNKGEIHDTAVTPSFGDGYYTYSGEGRLGDKYAFLTVYAYKDSGSYEVETTGKLYIWKFNTDKKGAPFEITKENNETIEKRNNLIASELNELYGINIYINEGNEYEEDAESDYYLETDAEPFDVYRVLTQLRAFLSYFPDGFIEELYTGYPYSEKTAFDIFIGRKIKNDDIGAYATAYDDTPSITFATETFSYSTMPHEFMHIIDSRITDYEMALEEWRYEDTFDYEWEQLNPEGFEYSGETDYDSYEQYENAFITSYSTTNAGEDRADLFAYIFTSIEYDEPPYWYIEGTPIYNKANLICKKIKEAFPSVQNTEKAYWEKWIN